MYVLVNDANQIVARGINNMYYARTLRDMFGWHSHSIKLAADRK